MCIRDRLETDVVFLLRNSIAPSALMEGLKLRQGYIEVTSLMETNIPGCFACGDCTGTPLQVSKAVGEGLIEMCIRDSHNGKLSLESEPGVGTTITVSLPME